MNSGRRATTVAGWLYVVAMVAGLLSIAAPVDSPDYLLKASANSNQMIVAAFFQLLMAPAYIGIATSLYPLLRQHNPHLAFGFASFRTIAGAFTIVGAILLLLLLTLSQEFVAAGAPDSSYFQALGILLQAGRDLVNHVAMVLTVSLGGLFFYSLLYQTKLVPRWLSAWGLAGTTLTILTTLLVMFRLIDIITTSYLVLNLPMAVQEMVLAVWLITKGFNPSAKESGSGSK